MTSKKDWLPKRRDEILGMAMKWNNVLAMKGKTWKVDEDKVTELNTLTMRELVRSF